jgi:hypothetical protein
LRALYSLLAILAIANIACRSTPPRYLDPEMAAHIPPGTIVLAGMDLDKLRGTSLAPMLPPITVNASYALGTYNGRDSQLLLRGHFREAPPGTTLISNTLAVFGGTQSGVGEAPTGLLEVAERIAPGGPVWLVSQGGVTLPLTGNAANVNQVLRLADFVTAVAHVGTSIQIDATAECVSSANSTHLEENLRAIRTFLEAANQHSPLKSLEIRRHDKVVQATFTTTPDLLRKLLPTL